MWSELSDDTHDVLPDLLGRWFGVDADDHHDAHALCAGALISLTAPLKPSIDAIDGSALSRPKIRLAKTTYEWSLPTVITRSDRWAAEPAAVRPDIMLMGNWGSALLNKNAIARRARKLLLVRPRVGTPKLSGHAARRERPGLPDRFCSQWL